MHLTIKERDEKTKIHRKTEEYIDNHTKKIWTEKRTEKKANLQYDTK